MARTTTLPEPTKDLDRAKADLAEFGYCLVADALDAVTVATLRARLIEVALEDVENGRGFIDGGGANQRVWQLLNRGSDFVELPTHPLALEMMETLIGGQGAYGVPGDGLPQYLLSSLTANIAGPGGEAMVLHADQGYIPFPWPDFPLVANIGWMLDDFTAENGATRVVPGSHKFHALPGRDAAAQTVPAEAPAGTALVFEGRLWHGTGQNTTAGEKRHGILSYYVKPWIRQQENQTVSVDRAVAEAASPTLRRLLGFDLWHSLGMVNGLPPLGTAPAPHHRRA